MSLADKLTKGFVFSEANRREHEEMALYIATQALPQAGIVPLAMLEHIPLSDAFMTAYLEANPSLSLVDMPFEARPVFVKHLITTNPELAAKLIVDMSWIKDTNPKFIDFYLKHWRLKLSCGLLKNIPDTHSRSAFIRRIIENPDSAWLPQLTPDLLPDDISYTKLFMQKYLENNTSCWNLISTLAETVREQFVRYIISCKLSNFYSQLLPYLTEELLTDDFMKDYCLNLFLYLPAQTVSDAERLSITRLTNYIVQHMPAKAGCISNLDLIKVPPSDVAIRACFEGVRARVSFPDFEGMNPIVRERFISYIHNYKLWETKIGGVHPSKRYHQFVTDLSWISHLPEDDESLKSLRERLQTSNTK